MSSYATNLLHELSSMREQKQFCDLCLRVNGHDYFCHKFLLIAASDYFKAMFTSSMRESSSDFVELKEFSHSSIGFEAMLDFCYSGSLKIDFEQIHLLLHAATHLQIAEAIRLCSDFLCQRFSLKNCLDLYRIAEFFSLEKLLPIFRSFISMNFIDLHRKSPSQFYQLTFEQIRDEISRDELEMQNADEFELFQIVSNWIEENRNERDQFSASLFQLIRFILISIEKLVDVIRFHPLIQLNEETKRLVNDAIVYHALPTRQPLIENDQNRIRNRTSLVAVGDVQLFTLTSDDVQWKSTCSAPLEESYPYPFSVLTVKNYLYVIGAGRTSSEENQIVYRFSPRNCQWTKLANLLHDRSRFASAHLNNFIYIFGGFQGFHRSRRVFCSTVDRYSIEHDRWELFSTDFPVLSSLAACCDEKSIYFGGGKNSNWMRVADFYRFSVETRQFDVCASMLKVRTSHVFHQIDNQILAIGGFGDDTNGILTIDSYDISTDQWTILTSIPGAMPTIWPQSIGLFDRIIYVSVSHSANTFIVTQLGYFFHFDLGKWCNAPVIHEKARHCPTVHLRFEKKIDQIISNK